MTDIIIIEDQSLLEQNQHFENWTPKYWNKSLNKIVGSFEDDVEESESNIEDNDTDDDIEDPKDYGTKLP